MGTLDQVMQLKGQGLGEEEIVNNLQQQGISPQEINDALNQANIKNAVTDQQPTGEAPVAEGTEGFYTPQTQEAGEQYSPPMGQAQEYYEEGAYQGGPPAGGMDSDTMIEIANQVFSEKIKKIQTKTEEAIEFKTITQTKIESIDERLKRIEKMIDNLQIKILEKVSSFGNEIRTTKKEVAMVENTLEKVMKGRANKKPKKIISKKKK